MPRLFPELRSPRPRAENLSTWLYKLRPSAMHAPFRRIDDRAIRSGRSTRSRRRPTGCAGIRLPIPNAPADFLDELITLAGSGEPAAQAGVAVHIYRAKPLDERPLLRRLDGELMFVPQTRRDPDFLRAWEKSASRRARSGRSARHQVQGRAAREAGSRLNLCENYGAPFRLPELGLIGAQGLAQARDFLAPVAAFEDQDAKCEVINKFMGGCGPPSGAARARSCGVHGRYAPYKYDLARSCDQHGELRSRGPVRSSLS